MFSQAPSRAENTTQQWIVLFENVAIVLLMLKENVGLGLFLTFYYNVEPELLHSFGEC